MNNSDMKKALVKAVKDYAPSGLADKNDPDAISRQAVVEAIQVKNLKLIGLRNGLLEIGKILEEDLDKQTYVLTVSAGWFNATTALAVARLEGNKVWAAAYAKEGLIKQSIAKGAIDKIKTVVQKHDR